MTTDKTTDTLWEELTTKLLKDFPIGRTLSIDSILYLIGLQEVGKLHDTFSRDDKINLIHVGTCKVLEPYGYYFFEYKDKEGWPFYRRTKDHLSLSEQQQKSLLKEAILSYFIKMDYLPTKP
ncbi:hypothetical protein [Capnocytophaga gingivalis]|uniref:hypothetical protein n=1 Tax=Capnocytophaga gingivalis TaxID=1017 RepID=UPI001CAF449C|nr:hypothetical protein [Capnocytophaga gingivalis]MBF1125458.1 hypothetical protein [Capnocytophaga sp.]